MIVKAVGNKISRLQAAHIVGMTPRHMHQGLLPPIEPPQIDELHVPAPPRSCAQSGIEARSREQYKLCDAADAYAEIARRLDRWLAVYPTQNAWRDLAVWL